MSTVVRGALEETRHAAETLRRGSPRTTAIVVLCLALVAIAPLALTLLRADHYTSSSTISLRTSDLGFGRSFELRSIQGLFVNALAAQPVQQQLENLANYLSLQDDASEHVDVRGRWVGDELRFVVTAEGPNADKAQRYSNAAASTLIGAAEPFAQLVRARLLKQTRKELRRSDPGSKERRTLAERQDLLAPAVRADDPVFEPIPSVGTLPEERFADRMVGRLPGEHPPRPSPIWVALAGIGLAAALGLWVLLLRGPLRRANARDSRLIPP